MEISSVERNKKNKERLSVYIDGRYSFSISEDDYLSLNLYEKRELTAEELDYIKNTLVFREAKSDAIRYLTSKLRTEKEVGLKLQDEGYDESTVDQVIEELRALGYINNKLYVQKYVFDRSKLKPISKRLMKVELQHRGIPDELIDEVLDDWNMDDSAVAEGLVRRKFGKYDLQDEKVTRKVYAFLKHRGYGYEIAEGVIRKLSEAK